MLLEERIIQRIDALEKEKYKPNVSIEKHKEIDDTIKSMKVLLSQIKKGE